MKRILISVLSFFLLGSFYSNEIKSINLYCNTLNTSEFQNENVSVSVRVTDTQNNVLFDEEQFLSKGDCYSLPEIDFYQLKKVTNAAGEVLEIVDGKLIVDSDIALNCVYETASDYKDLFYEGDMESGIFPHDVKWHQIKMDSRKNFTQLKTWIFDAEESRLKLIDTDMPVNGYDEAQMWCLVGTPAKFKIFNKAAGALVCANKLGEKVVFAEEDPLNSTWKIVRSGKTPTHFDIRAINANTNIAASGNGFSGDICYWPDMNDDEGAVIVYKTTDVLRKEFVDELDAMYETAKLHPGCIGSPRDLKEWENAKSQITDKVSWENAYQIFFNNPDLIALVPGKYYRIENYGRKVSTANLIEPHNGGFLEYVDLNTKEMSGLTKPSFVAMDKSMQRANAIWKIEEFENGQFLLRHMNSGKYSTQGTSIDYVSTADDVVSAGKNQILPVGRLQYQIVPENQIAFHISGASPDNKGALLGYNPQPIVNSTSAWFIIPAETIELNISSAGFATVQYPFAVELPSEIRAYTGQADMENSRFLLTELPENKIPANTPAIIEGKEGLYPLSVLNEEIAGTENNDLRGTLLARPIPLEETAYILGNLNDFVGFYKLAEDESDRTLAQNKAYLSMEENHSALKLVLDYQNTTNILGNKTSELNKKEIYYNLNGQRIESPKRGIYVTDEGRKVFLMR